jgi:uncharacterized protein
VTTGGYGFVHDTSHHLWRSAPGDFTASARITGAFEARYDQLGLMAWVDEATWVKCGIEFDHDRPWASAVVTRDRSDWSLAPLPDSFDPSAGVKIRLHRRGDTVEADWALPGGPRVPLRLATLSQAAVWRVGPLAASPSRAGFTATFHDVAVGPPEPTAT